MKQIWCIIAALVLQCATTNAQAIPYSTTSKVTWYHDNGTSTATAQGFTFRLYVDGATTPITMSGATCVAPTSVDSTGAIWLLGNGSYPNIPIVRNGSQVVSTFGARIVPNLGIIYIQGDDLLWYKWSGTAFGLTTAADPTDAALLAASNGRWQCSAPFSPRLAITLNVLGQHNLKMRVYDAVSMVESPDSNVIAVVSTALTAPMAAKVTP